MPSSLSALRGLSLPVRVLSAPVLAVILIAAMRAGTFGSATSFSLALAAIYGIVVLAVSLLAGWAGVWSVGHPALMAIGAYTAAWGSSHHWGLEPTVLVAVGLAAATGALIGFAGARFSILYIALLTLAFDLVVLELVGRLVHITGGDQGVPAGPLPSRIGLPGIESVQDTLTVPVAVFALLLALTVLMRRSALRMRMVAAKSHPLVSRTVGIAPEAQVAFAFAISAAIAAVAGVLLAESSGFVSPEPFSLSLAINIIAAAVLGGIGSTTGAVVGGAFMAWSGDIANALGIDVPILQGLVLIVLLILLPRGIVPTLNAVLRRALRARSGRAAPPVTHSAPVADDPSSAPGSSRATDSRSPVLLSVRDISVRFAGLVALRDASLEVRAGEVLGVIGPNGAGKTTLLNTLSGVNTGGKVTGDVVLGGVQLARGQATHRRKHGIGRTFQHAELFPELTVSENVVCTTRWASRRRRTEVRELLTRLGLGQVLDTSPEELPFGLRKRVDLARAAAEQPQLLLLDEPFGGLDPTERAHIRDQITRMNSRGMGVLVIDHVLDDLFAVADRIVAFDFGTPLAEGAPGAILQNDQVRTSYLGAGAPVRTSARSAGGAPLISLKEVGFHYGGVSALNGIDLELRAGQILAVVGANGAGKSTLGRILGGAVAPTAGSRDVHRLDGRTPRCSVVPEGRALFRTLSIRENLEVAAYGVGLHGRRARQQVEEMIAWLPERLHDRVGVSAGSLSGGEQQMLAVARGLIGSPDVLVLDEPALGLAPMLIEEVYRRIAGLAEAGLTVVLLEQLLARAAAVCDDIVILHDGVIAGSGRGDDEAFLLRAERAYFGAAASELLDLEPGQSQPAPLSADLRG